MDLPLTMNLTWLPQAQSFLYFLAWAFAPKLSELIQSFNSWPLFFVSMATRLSDLDDHKPGINIQTEGHTLTPPSIQNGPEDPVVFGSAPSHSPSQSLARKPTPDWPETWYCLEIQVTSTEDERVTPPSPHMWQVPIVEDMVWDGKAGLTEAIVTGPGWAILLY